MEFKGARRSKSNTSGSSVDPRFGQKKRCGATICGRIGDNIEGCKRNKSAQSENAAIDKVQPSKMEINMVALGAANARRKITMLDTTTLLD